MKILKPHKITSEIFDIIHEAKEYILIVSPYVNFKNWERLASELSKAKNRGIRIDFFVRNEVENVNSWEEIESIGLKPRLINNLHAKFYFNETTGIISSMNLLSSSNSNSIEIGCKIETNDELEELKQFVKDFIIPNECQEKPSETDLFLSKEKFIIALEEYLSDELKKPVETHFRNGVIIINTGKNNYTLVIDKVSNVVEFGGILSSKEAKALEPDMKKYFKSDYFNYELSKGDGSYYDQVFATSTVKLSNSNLDRLRVSEKKILIPEISNFVKCVQDFKDSIRYAE